MKDGLSISLFLTVFLIFPMISVYTNIVWFVVFTLIVCIFILIAVLFRGLWKPLACKVGWHSYEYDTVSHDGCSTHAQCQWCKYEGMIDSQGNLF
jgi:hypothetical protein